MRRHLRSLILICILFLLSILTLAFPTIKIGGFERGGDTVLGLKLGLELQGGIHLVYEAEVEDPVTGELITPTSEQMEALRKTIERRVNSSGLGDPVILLLGDNRLVVQLPGVRDRERARSLVGETARLEFKHRRFNIAQEVEGLTAEAPLSVAIVAMPQDEPPVEGGATESATSTPAAGVAPALPESTTSTEAAQSATSTQDAEAPGDGGDGQDAVDAVPALLVELTDQAAIVMDGLLARLRLSQEPVPGTSDIFPSLLEIRVEGVESRVMQVTYYPMVQIPNGPLLPLEGEPLISRITGTNNYRISMGGLASTVAEAREIFGDDLTASLYEILGVSDEDIGLTGDDLARAYPGQHSGSGAPIINIEFKDRGTKIFGELTSEIAGTPDQIAIFLDGEELIAPVVQTAISGGVAFIQGRDFTIERVRDVSLLLEAGRLPIPLGDPIFERDVGPSLGEQSLRKSLVAGLVGVTMVLLFMALYYRALGFVAAGALVIYVSMVLAVFKILPVTLNLAGVAAIILSVGMAVDANILIFERMKEELRTGRTLLSAINIGFNRAWPAIRDSNVSTLITCAILFWFSDRLGNTIVQGFAITLAVGVGLSMFSAITISRTFLRVVAETRLGDNLGLFLPAGSKELPSAPAAPTRGN